MKNTIRIPIKKTCERIDLAQNFRSRKEILDGVNFIFSQIMTKKASELDYGEAEALRCGFSYPQNDKSLCSPIEVALFAKEIHPTPKEDDEEGDLQGFEKEAVYIVNRLQKLIQNNYPHEGLSTIKMARYRHFIAFSAK